MLLLLGYGYAHIGNFCHRKLAGSVENRWKWSREHISHAITVCSWNDSDMWVEKRGSKGWCQSTWQHQIKSIFRGIKKRGAARIRTSENSTEKCLSKCQRVKCCQRLTVGSPFDGLLEKGFPYHLAGRAVVFQFLSASFQSTLSYIFKVSMDLSTVQGWQETDFFFLPMIFSRSLIPTADEDYYSRDK